MTGVPFFEPYEHELREKHSSVGEQIFTVSGLTGVGTSTLAASLADRFGLDHVDAGQFFRKKAAEYGLGIREFDERTEELERAEDTDFDIEWDRTALRYAFTRDRFVLEGRLAGVLLADLAPVRIWVTCDPEEAARRIQGREGFDSLAEARSYIETRNAEVLSRYREKYGVDPTDDRFYTIVIDNTGGMDGVTEELVREVEEEASQDFNKGADHQ